MWLSERLNHSRLHCHLKEELVNWNECLIGSLEWGISLKQEAFQIPSPAPGVSGSSTPPGRTAEGTLCPQARKILPSLHVLSEAIHCSNGFLSFLGCTEGQSGWRTKVQINKRILCMGAWTWECGNERNASLGVRGPWVLRLLPG